MPTHEDYTSQSLKKIFVSCSNFDLRKAMTGDYYELMPSIED